MLTKFFKTVARNLGFEVQRLPTLTRADLQKIPHPELYRPLFSPWYSTDFDRFFQLAAPKTLVSADRCYVLLTLLRQAAHLNGEIWECGVYKGGTAAMMAAFLAETAPEKQLRLFDTFEGMPETDARKDRHKAGDFHDTSLEQVSDYVGHADRCKFYKGLIPSTFSGLESSKIAFAHIDVDIYKSIQDCLTFIWPRLSQGGFIVFDDYGFPSCPGARAAVDEFFAHRSCVPLCLSTGQAIVFNGVVDSPAEAPFSEIA